ncbi:MAG: exodeoxyribonuclease VII small subunit [Clostridia bacterium]|nr:exodeoxyribonuclease VII small subunit [Clostridia bacterium]
MNHTENEASSTAKRRTKKEEQTFESALARLNEIVAALESGSTPLDSALSMYEEGVQLVRFCSDKLSAAEAQIKVLAKTADGTIEERDFPQNKTQTERKDPD